MNLRHVGAVVLTGMVLFLVVGPGCSSSSSGAGNGSGNTACLDACSSDADCQSGYSCLKQQIVSQSTCIPTDCKTCANADKCNFSSTPAVENSPCTFSSCSP